MEIGKTYAYSSEMICLNCRHYDPIWFNCKFLGFDGVRENPNMHCNVEFEENGLTRFAFDRRNEMEMHEAEERAEKILGDDTVKFD